MKRNARRLAVTAGVSAFLLLGAASERMGEVASDYRSDHMERVTAIPAPSMDVCGAVPDWDYLPAAPGTLGAWITGACDYRVTGDHCEEDEWCAVAEIATTGNYNPRGA